MIGMSNQYVKSDLTAEYGMVVDDELEYRVNLLFKETELY